MDLYVLAGVCVAVSAVTAWLRNKSYEKMRFASKMVASLLFCLIAFLALSRREEPMNYRVVLMLCALLLGLFGDIFLGIDHLVKEDIRSFMFLVGGIPFFFGHITYIVLLLSYGDIQLWLLPLVPLTPFACWLLKKYHVVNPGRKSFVLLMGYSVVLGLMMLSTINLAVQGGTLGKLMIFPGILFAISDSTLFISRYCTEKFHRFRPAFSYTVMLPYYAAQALFALAVAYL